VTGVVKDNLSAYQVLFFNQITLEELEQNLEQNHFS